MLQDVEEVINVHTEEGRWAYCSLSNTIGYWWPELIRSIPFDLSWLGSVDKYKCPEEHWWHLFWLQSLEECYPFNKVKSLAQIRSTSIYSSSLAIIVVNDSIDCPGTNGCTWFLLEATLQLITSKFLPLYHENDYIKQFQNLTVCSNGPVIIRLIYVTEIILYQWEISSFGPLIRQSDWNSKTESLLLQFILDKAILITLL